MINLKITSVLLLMLTTVGCVSKNKNANTVKDFTVIPSERFVIYEDSLQNIILNGRPLSLIQLDSLLRELKPKGMSLFYDCSRGTKCPPDHSPVIDLVSKYKLKLYIII